MTNCKIALVVVLYNKTMQQSITLKSLNKFKNSLHHLLIVNNGPKFIENDDKFLLELQERHVLVELENQLQNKPLSWIYNDLIEKNYADYYVIFDDDTEINKNYEYHLFHVVPNEKIDIEFPEIRARIDEKPHFPVVDSELRVKKGKIKNIKTIFSAGSGLILSRYVTNVFIQHYGHVFDQHFAFYGVDSTFFIRLNKMLCKKNIFNLSSNTYLNHGLSLTEEKLTDWRKIEFIYENTLKIKYYSGNKFLAILKFIRLMYRKLSHFELRDFKLVVKTFVHGKHPRC